LSILFYSSLLNNIFNFIMSGFAWSVRTTNLNAPLIRNGHKYILIDNDTTFGGVSFAALKGLYVIQYQQRQIHKYEIGSFKYLNSTLMYSTGSVTINMIWKYIPNAVNPTINILSVDVDAKRIYETVIAASGITTTEITNLFPPEFFTDHTRGNPIINQGTTIINRLDINKSIILNGFYYVGARLIHNDAFEVDYTNAVKYWLMGSFASMRNEVVELMYSLPDLSPYNKGFIPYFEDGILYMAGGVVGPIREGDLPVGRKLSSVDGVVSYNQGIKRFPDSSGTTIFNQFRGIWVYMDKLGDKYILAGGLVNEEPRNPVSRIIANPSIWIADEPYAIYTPLPLPQSMISEDSFYFKYHDDLICMIGNTVYTGKPSYSLSIQNMYFELSPDIQLLNTPTSAQSFPITSTSNYFSNLIVNYKLDDAAAAFIKNKTVTLSVYDADNVALKSITTEVGTVINLPFSFNNRPKSTYYTDSIEEYKFEIVVNGLTQYDVRGSRTVYWGNFLPVNPSSVSGSLLDFSLNEFKARVSFNYERNESPTYPLFLTGKIKYSVDHPDEFYEFDNTEPFTLLNPDTRRYTVDNILSSTEILKIHHQLGRVELFINGLSASSRLDMPTGPLVFNPTNCLAVYGYTLDGGVYKTLLTLTFNYQMTYGISNTYITVLDNDDEVLTDTMIASNESTFKTAQTIVIEYPAAVYATTIRPTLGVDLYGIRSKMVSCDLSAVVPMSVFDIELETGFVDGDTFYKVDIDTANTYTNIIYTLKDITTVEIQSTNEISRTITLTGDEHFGKAVLVSVELYRVNRGVSYTVNKQIPAYVRPLVPVPVDATEEYDGINTKIIYRFSGDYNGTDLVEITVDGTTLSGTLADHTTLNDGIYTHTRNIPTNKYGDKLPMTFKLIPPNIPYDFDRFGAVFVQTPITPIPAAPANLSFNETADTTTILDISFTTTEYITSIKTEVELSGNVVYTNTTATFDKNADIISYSIEYGLELFGLEGILKVSYFIYGVESPIAKKVINSIDSRPVKPIIGTSTQEHFQDDDDLYKLRLTFPITSVPNGVFAYEIYRDQTMIINKTQTTNNTIIIILEDEDATEFVSTKYGLKYSIRVRVRTIQSDQDRFYSDYTIQEAESLPSIVPSVSLVEQFIAGDTTLNIDITGGRYTYFDLTMDSITTRYENTQHLELPLASFGIQVSIRIKFVYLNDPYGMAPTSTYNAAAPVIPEITLLDVSANHYNLNVVFNFNIETSRSLLATDKLMIRIYDNDDLILDVLHETVNNVFYLENEVDGRYFGDKLTAEVGILPIYTDPSFVKFTRHAIYRYKMALMSQLDGVITVNEEFARIEYTPKVNFMTIASLQLINSLDELPQHISTEMTDDFTFMVSIKNPELISRTIYPATNFPFVNGYYTGPPIPLELSNYGKQLEVDVSYSLRNTDLYSDKIQYLPPAPPPPRPSVSFSRLLFPNFTANINIFYDMEFVFSQRLDHLYIELANSTTSTTIINRAFSFNELTKLPTYYTTSVSLDDIARNHTFYLNVYAKHYGVRSDSGTLISSIDELSPPYSLEVDVSFDDTKPIETAYVLNKLSFDYDGFLTDLSYTLYNVEIGEVLESGMISNFTIEAERFTSLDVINLHAEHYLDKLELRLQAYDSGIDITSEMIIYDGFVHSLPPVMPDIRSAKLDPANNKLVVAMIDPSGGTIWSYSNLRVYVDGELIYDEIYSLTGGTFLPIQYNESVPVANRIYVMEADIPEEDLIGNVDVCANVIAKVLTDGELVRIKESDYDHFTGNIELNVAIANITSSTLLEYRRWELSFNVVPEQEREFITEYKLYEYHNPDIVPVPDASYSLWKTIDYRDMSGHIDTFKELLEPNTYYYFKIVVSHGTVESTLADSEAITLLTGDLFTVSMETFAFSSSVLDNDLSYSITFNGDISEISNNIVVSLDISGYNNQTHPTQMYVDGELELFIPDFVYNESQGREIYIYNDWKQNINTRITYYGLTFYEASHVVETPVLLEEIVASSYKVGLWKTGYRFDWKPIPVNPVIFVYSYIAEDVILTPEQVEEIPTEDYQIIGSVMASNNFFTMNQPKMPPIQKQTHVIRFRAKYNPESELTDPFIFYESNCGFSGIQTDKKQQIYPQLTKKQQYRRGLTHKLL
jgi:hypothetical protein